MTDVFVSYKAEDRSRVAPLVRALESDGVSVWWDAHIGAGDEWRETILRQLESARAVIVVWSKRSIGPEGRFVRDEASRAVKRKTYLPVRIDKVDPPLGFGETQAHDLAGWKGDRSDPRYEGLTFALRQRFAIRRKRPANTLGATSRVSRRSLMVGAGAGVACVAGVGTWFALRSSGGTGESIAVLPFENLSGDPSQAYFSDGIAEELRSALAGIPGLKVVARTSSEAVRNVDVVTAAAKLHVTDVLTGSVRRSPEMLRISAQLIDGKDGTQRWSEDYDRPIGDSLKIQSEIAQRVAEALRLRIGPANNNLHARGGTDNPRAEDLYLRGQATARDNDSEAGIRAALALAEAALLEDPKYGNAMTSKASYLSSLGSTFATNSNDAQLLMQQAQDAAVRAVELAPLSAPAHASLAGQYFWSFQFASALKEFQKVLSLRGVDASSLASIARYLAMLRRFDVALRLADEAVTLDPLNPGVHQNRAKVLQYGGRLTEAEQSVQRAMQLSPGLWYTHLIYALIFLQSGRLAQAQREAATVNHASTSVIATQAVIAERLGDRSQSNQLLQQILSSDALSAAHYQVAQVYAQENRNDEAISELRKALVARDPGLAQIQVDFLFDPLRKDPRFQDFVKKLNFPD
jgi:serine/threonine-protein kinase